MLKVIYQCVLFFVSYKIMTDIFDELFHSSATAADDLVLKSSTFALV